MKTHLNIIISRDNLIEFQLEPSGMKAVAQLMEFEPQHHAAMDVVSQGFRGKCPKPVMPYAGDPIWVVTTDYAGCFWARDIYHVTQELSKDSAAMEERVME